MLDSLGSTLSSKTVDSFWLRFGKDPHAESIDQELTMEECIVCIEDALSKPISQRKRLDDADYKLADGDGATGANTPSALDQQLEEHDLQQNMANMNFAGPPGNVPTESIRLKPSQPTPHPTVPNSQPINDVTPRSKDVFTPTRTAPDAVARASSQNSRMSTSSTSSLDPSDADSGAEDSPAFERVINIQNCPLCHRPRMRSKGEVDIVTHMALCASQDWRRVDKIVVGNFVTSSQAQRKWYTKLLGKVSAGSYQLGAVSINIPVTMMA
jgi:phosphatidylserine decarboxylase